MLKVNFMKVSVFEKIEIFTGKIKTNWIIKYISEKIGGIFNKKER